MNGFAQARFEAAGLAAKHLFEALHGMPYPAEARFEFLDADGFVASVDEDALIQVSSGVIDRLDRLWRDVLQSQVLIREDGASILDAAEPNRLADMSLTWLILHELMHVALGHVAMTGSMSLAEIESISADDRAATPSADFLLALREHLPDVDASQLRKCAELQADCEASDVLLGVYAEERWDEIRIHACCIFAVMALIEGLNRESGQTHPSAQARFFMLLGQLFQLWLQPNVDLDAGDGETWLRNRAPPVWDGRQNSTTGNCRAPAANWSAKVALCARLPNITACIPGRWRAISELDDLVRSVRTTLTVSSPRAYA